MPHTNTRAGPRRALNVPPRFRGRLTPRTQPEVRVTDLRLTVDSDASTVTAVDSDATANTAAVDSGASARHAACRGAHFNLNCLLLQLELSWRPAAGPARGRPGPWPRRRRRRELEPSPNLKRVNKIRILVLLARQSLSGLSSLVIIAGMSHDTVTSESCQRPGRLRPVSPSPVCQYSG
jgi:hypothetical protein